MNDLISPGQAPLIPKNKDRNAKGTIREDVRELIKDLLTKGVMTHAAIAERAGVSTWVVSQVKKKLTKAKKDKMHQMWR